MRPAGRTLVPRRALPGTRAVVGGLLVAVAVVGTWWVGADQGGPPATRYLVAASDIAPGDRIGAADLTATAADLPPELRRQAFTDPDRLVGMVATGPVGAGELVQAGAVVEGAGVQPARELSFVVDTAWAVAGTLQAGDRIDLWVTYGDGPEAETTLVLDRVVLRRITEPDGEGLGASDDQTVTVALPTIDQVRAATSAARAGTLTLTRSTDAGSDDGSEPTTTTTATAEATTTTRKRGGG